MLGFLQSCLLQYIDFVRKQKHLIASEHGVFSLKGSELNWNFMEKTNVMSVRK